MREHIAPLPSVEEIAERYPADVANVQRNRMLMNAVLDGSDPRMLVLTGPCSASNPDTIARLSDDLVRFQEEVRDKIVLGLRVYIQKPRTELGWPGSINMPDPNGAPDLVRGVHQCAQMMSNVSSQNPIADEMLFTHNNGHFSPYISYTALGARSAEDGEHRHIASGEDMPIGIKNPRSGDIDDAVSGVVTVQSGHDHAHYGNWVRSSGSPYAHVILRGGKTRTNFGPDSIYETSKLLQKKEVQHPAIVVDASHDNSRSGNGKDPRLQEFVLQSIALGKQLGLDGYEHVRGLMLECNMKGGNQKISSHMDPDVSITDPCIPNEDMKRMVRGLAEKL
jgi:3-deoxy-7-phosphoheptulonate synthase